MRDRRLILAAIVVLAAAVRLAGIGDRLSADEGYTWLVASSDGANVFLDRLAAYENTPPLFYLLTSLLPDGDEAWLRLVPFLASVACVPVLYAIVRPLLGTSGALLSALALAVAPYHVSFANYSRAFMLGSLGLLLALWAVARLTQGGRRRWWALYVAGATIAYWCTYDSWLFMAALTAALLIAGGPPRREVAAFSALPAVLFLPWAHQALRGLDALDESKLAPEYPAPTPGGVRDTLVPLFFGEHGAADSEPLRWLQLLGLMAALAWGAAQMWKRGRTELLLLPGVAIGTLALHAIVALAGPDVFAQRYLTVLIPLGGAVVAYGVAQVPWRLAVPAAAGALVVLGLAVFVTRFDRELEPDPRPVLALLEEKGGDRRVLTNSAVMAYYLRELHPRLDRPFGLGRGLDAACTPPLCETAFAIVDDTRVAGGLRPGPGERSAFGPLAVRLEP